MNLQKLFEEQKKLDDRIKKEKGLEGQDLLEKKTLALQVELGELANNWRGFKFWSENQKARTTGKEKCFACEGAGRFVYPNEFVDGHTYAEGCAECQGTGWIPTDKNPLLEEYVDCLHFILSIGNDIGYRPTKPKAIKKSSAIEQFHEMFYLIADLHYCSCIDVGEFEIAGKYLEVFEFFLGLGEMLEFTWEQIKEAYFYKNEINHVRQENGY